MIWQNWDKITSFFSESPPDLTDATPEFLEIAQEIGEAFLGILDGSDWTEMAEILGELTEGLVDGVDVGEAIGTLGLSLLASYGVKKVFDHLNKEDEEALRHWKVKHRPLANPRNNS